MTSLANYLQTNFSIPRHDVATILSYFKPTQLLKAEYIVKTGQYCRQLSFLEGGIIREYFTTEDKEITKWMSTQGYFIVDLQSFLYDVPARWNLQAFTDCELMTLTREDYKKLGKHFPIWPALEKTFISACFSTLEDRVVSHISLTAEERYHQYFKQYPALFNIVPLQYLASILGMTPETLSRIRSKKMY